jgi:hypothetical protein
MLKTCCHSKQPANRGNVMSSKSNGKWGERIGIEGRAENRTRVSDKGHRSKLEPAHHDRSCSGTLRPSPSPHWPLVVVVAVYPGGIQCSALAHFGTDTLGRSLCESAIWLDYDEVNDRFRHLLSPHFESGSFLVFPLDAIKEQVAEQTCGMTARQARAYFAGAAQRLQQATGQKVRVQRADRKRSTTIR